MSTVQVETPASTTPNGAPFHDECKFGREQYWNAQLQDGQALLIRQMRKRDIEMQRRFIQELPRTSHRFRFAGTMAAPGEDPLRQHYDFDAGRDVTLVASTGQGAEQKGIGIGRFTREAGRACRFSVVVSRAWQERGVGTLLMQHLICSAIDRGIQSMHSVDAADDAILRAFAAQLGFKRDAIPNDASHVLYRLDLARRHSDSDFMPG